jgi:hypothetical protein
LRREVAQLLHQFAQFRVLQRRHLSDQIGAVCEQPQRLGRDRAQRNNVKVSGHRCDHV